MKSHKKHDGHPHDKMAAMPQFNEGHWEKAESELDTANMKYTKSEMGNPEALQRSVKGLVGYAKKHEMKYS